MKRLAAIDIGTNSTKITLADVGEDGALKVVAEDTEITRLGEGVDSNRRLSSDAVARTLDVVTRFANMARQLGAQEVLAAGTSALRDAYNGPYFIEQARERARIEIEVITGDQEAQLAYRAVRSDPALNLSRDTPLLVFDIGGGSTELILGDASGVGRHASLDIGAVRLTERFFETDPPTADELTQAAQYTDTAFAAFPAPEPVPTVAGIGGTVVNIAAVTLGLSAPDPEAVHGIILTRAQVSAALHRFQSIPLDQRRRIPGLEPKRADIITAGALILDHLLTYFGASQVTVSARGLRYGLLAERAEAR